MSPKKPDKAAVKEKAGSLPICHITPHWPVIESIINARMMYNRIIKQAADY
ncbi:MAG TPA: hypothetical protein VMC84_04630 [Methanocella sp.]|nr:hypothetical protein [Methanocella sp.]